MEKELIKASISLLTRPFITFTSPAISAMMMAGDVDV